MITKEMLKSEIDQVQNEYLELLYNIIKAFVIADTGSRRLAVNRIKENNKEWQNFINSTYGCLSDDPIERGDQGIYETRMNIQ